MSSGDTRLATAQPKENMVSRQLESDDETQEQKMSVGLVKTGMISSPPREIPPCILPIPDELDAASDGPTENGTHLTEQEQYKCLTEQEQFKPLTFPPLSPIHCVRCRVIVQGM